MVTNLPASVMPVTPVQGNGRYVVPGDYNELFMPVPSLSEDAEFSDGLMFSKHLDVFNDDGAVDAVYAGVYRLQHATVTCHNT